MGKNESHVYALASWTVQKKRSGWFIKLTYANGPELGPYRSAMSACLTIGRQLHKEFARRSAPAPMLPLNGAEKPPASAVAESTTSVRVISR
jgi:hypothetical protein